MAYYETYETYDSQLSTLYEETRSSSSSSSLTRVRIARQEARRRKSYQFFQSFLFLSIHLSVPSLAGGQWRRRRQLQQGVAGGSFKLVVYHSTRVFRMYGVTKWRIFMELQIMKILSDWAASCWGLAACSQRRGSWFVGSCRPCMRGCLTCSGANLPAASPCPSAA
jgi:hypothetical protein